MIQNSFKIHEHEKFKGTEAKVEPGKIRRDPLLLFIHLSAAWTNLLLLPDSFSTALFGSIMLLPCWPLGHRDAAALDPVHSGKAAFSKFQ